MKRSKKCPQYHLIGHVRLNNCSVCGKSHYGKWIWRLDTIWMDDGL